MKFTLNTLGAPDWDLEQTAKNARAYGYAGVDLRLLDSEVISLASVRANLGRLRSLFPRDELPIAVLATSVRLATNDPAVRQTTLDETYAWIDLAAELNVPVIRVFGARNPPELDLERSIQAVGEMLAQLSSRAEQAGVKVGVETHDEFANADSVARALQLAPSTAVGAIWDMWHTLRAGNSPAQALDVLGSRVLNVHLKDARRSADGWQLLLLGEGDIPVKEGLRLLKQRGYDDFISVEWEKKWHPEIPGPEVAFPQHMAVLREYVRELE
ncbi:MAG TPA: sugar phosphate isomerase/epimerase family protein [Chloroflexota bacterium]|jgi:fatty-acyl-CoA synthase|nr:sugar phosphate isomerase/epimerase family protein [Chloroflexota bacterium]